MEQVDLVVHPEWIIPVIPENVVLEGHSVAIRDGQIVAIDSRDQIESGFQPASEIELPNELMLPGLINAHGHSAMSLLRGYADDLPLMTWLNDHIWPAESKWVSEEFVREGSELACAEMIRSGTTCFSDMYFFPETTASVAIHAGLRSLLTFPVLDFSSAWAADGEEYIHNGLELFDQYKGHPLIQIGFGPHAPYTVADDLLDEVAKYANELEMPIQIHLHETAFEVEEAVKSTGQRPIQRLAERAILGPRTQCVHMTQVSDEDIELLLTWNSHVIHCPESNLKLASGFCPVQNLLDKGVNVALGTDGAASNNDLNLIGEMRTAALIGKTVAGDATAVSAHQAIRMATINGARALGIQHKIGSLEPGKQADIICLNLSGLESTPIYNPASQFVYSTAPGSVTHSWVNGKLLLDNGQLTTLDAETIATRARKWAEQIHRG